jgi:hypothetical protein
VAELENDERHKKQGSAWLPALDSTNSP